MQTPLSARTNGAPQPQRLQQRLLDACVDLERQTVSPSRLRRLSGALGAATLRPFLQRLNPANVVSAELWGKRLYMRADHRLPHIVARYPQFNEPLGILAETVAREDVVIIDVGANIGDTVALIDSMLPGKGRFLCIEPDADFADFCDLNTRAIGHVSVERSLLSDEPGRSASLFHHTPGTAAVSSSQVTLTDEEAALTTRTLDDVAAEFLSQNQRLDVLKIDTDGFDFKILRSAVRTLRQYQPEILFEYHPTLWRAAGTMDPVDVFKFLGELGYENFTFFSNIGQFHAIYERRDVPVFDLLTDLSLARHHSDDLHFDVLCGRREVGLEVARKSIERTSRLFGRN